MSVEWQACTHLAPENDLIVLKTGEHCITVERHELIRLGRLLESFKHEGF